MKQTKLSRRTFLAAGVVSIVSRRVVAGSKEDPPSERLNIAVAGVGGQGYGDVLHVAARHNLVAFCDVDDRRAAQAYKQWPSVPRYKDFRVMFDKEKGIDAVIVSTPNHTHGVIALAAMELGKHVFVEKPMAHTIYEVRRMTEAAAKYKVATQMGNQGHASYSLRQMKAWIADDAIGPVREVQCWTHFPSWPQGMERPTDTPTVPAELDWDLWLGPAPARPYHRAYVPGAWRGWWAFGEGALGDMGCHTIDGPYYALNLGWPDRVTAETSGLSPESAPKWSEVRYEFPARGSMPALTMTWQDGGKMPPRPPELEAERRMGDDIGGALFIGDKGKIMMGAHCSGARIIPEEKMKAYKGAKKELPRSPGHFAEWLQACKGGAPAGSNFSYAGPLTELVFLGILAIRTGKPIEWDAANMKAKGVPEAEEFIYPKVRDGWKV